MATVIIVFQIYGRYFVNCSLLFFWLKNDLGKLIAYLNGAKGDGNAYSLYLPIFSRHKFSFKQVLKISVMLLSNLGRLSELVRRRSGVITKITCFFFTKSYILYCWSTFTIVWQSDYPMLRWLTYNFSYNEHPSIIL